MASEWHKPSLRKEPSQLTFIVTTKPNIIARERMRDIAKATDYIKSIVISPLGRMEHFKTTSKVPVEVKPGHYQAIITTTVLKRQSQIKRLFGRETKVETLTKAEKCTSYSKAKSQAMDRFHQMSGNII